MSLREVRKGGSSNVLYGEPNQASGHSHRLGQVYKRNVESVYTWIETGCLCDLNPEYGEGQTMDWMHGFGYGMFRRHSDRFVVHTLSIVKSSVVFGEREIFTVRRVFTACATIRPPDGQQGSE